jgi:23S rRNA U2552 (ribose-2'-O)-methylase RlmE/FtsJ
MIKRIQDIQGFLRAILRPMIQSGDIVLDLTAGRGRDTHFLAECVGEEGHVHAFDVQPIALEETRKLLEQHHLESRVTLHHVDHAQVLEKIHTPIQVAMFNLGYLPGHNQEIITLASSTITALKAVLKLLRTGGVIALTLYRGHEGGDVEAQAVEAFLQSLQRRTYSVLRGEYMNQGENAPYWILVQKNRGDMV